MNTLSNFLEQPISGEPVHDAPGSESDWLHFAELTLSSGRLLICDLGFVPSEDDGLVVKLPTGRYEVLVKVMTYPGDRRISRLRVLTPGAQPSLGEQLDTTWTDTASTAVCDLRPMQAAWDRLGEDAAMERLDATRDAAGPSGMFDLEPGTGAIAAFVNSGFGDGTFPVFELKANKRLVGIEIEFIAAEERYPFGGGTPEVEDKDAEATDGDDRFKAFSEMLSQVVAGRTGDREKDRAAMKGKFDEFLEGMKKQAAVATNEFRQHVIQKRRAAPALRVRLQPAPDEAWLRQPPISDWHRFLERAGFVTAGTFIADPIPNFVLCGFVHVDLRIRAQITQSPKQSALILASRMSDGTEYSVVNLPVTRGMVRPGWAHSHCLPGLEPTALLEEFLRRRPDGEWLPIQPGDFAAWEEAIFLRTQTWRSERGGWSVDEIKNQRGLDPDAETTDELIMARHDSAEMWLYNWLRLQEGLPFDPGAVIEEVVIIHDDLTLDLLMNEWWVATKDFSVRKDAFADGTPREAFARVNRARGEPLRLAVAKPYPYEADYYLPR